MELIKIGIMDADKIAPLVAAFRTQLKSYKGIKSQPDAEAGKEEILEYLESDFPVYAVADSGAFVGYIVCRIDHPCGSSRSLCGKTIEEKALPRCFSTKPKRLPRQWAKTLFTTLFIRTMKT